MQTLTSLLWTPSTASPLIFSPPAAHVSAPSYATGPPLMASAHLAWISPSMLHSSCTTSTVPRAGSSQQHHHHASRRSVKRNHGTLLRTSATMAEASWPKLTPRPVFRQSSRPSIFWLWVESFGSEVNRKRLPAAPAPSIAEVTQLHPVPSVPRVMVHPGATETACGQRVDYAVIV